MRTGSLAMTVKLGTAAVMLLLAAPFCAQMHKVEKPERVTRSIGVYEWTGDLKKPSASRLIPVSLFINSHFEDGDLYLARPVPFTLETGDEYSIERAGQSLGLFDIEFARDVVTRRSMVDDDPVGAWYGYGKFELPPPKKKSNLKASAKEPRIFGGGDDDQPHFAVRAGAEDNGSSTGDNSKSGTSSSSGSTRTGTTTSPAPDDDPDRPTLRHRDPRPDTKHEKKQKDGGSVIPLGTSLNDDPDRPILHRGTPEEDELPKALTGIPADMQQAVAVSDASGNDPHVFTREWESSVERADTLKAVEVLARPLVAAYLAANKLQPVAAAVARSSSGPSFANTPASAPEGPPRLTPRSAPVNTPPNSKSTATHKRAVAKKAAAVVPLALTDEDIRGYELSYGGLPTFVYTAETPVAEGGPVYLTMVTQQLPSGEMQVALTNVTDATHLNRVPWMRPVDVVDPDGSHRASLLMELRGPSSRQFALYSLVTAKAEQQFVTAVIE
ncbi:hypothetical protein GOB94_08285 [Granulicella sp. 5B5]|uniref:hypothetical protein n=1 Tax=Granulicella sp. 5B5 TaxID=1617967 RepID=UPI0015F4A03E|nr:hypothetical protein [Granulicella sp. 5B5]QMV18676.1 hypothetical protein GOB94_08285 [Granulicella sp. 5B5]